MRGYRIFVIGFSILLVLYLLAELNRPTPIDWSLSLSKDEKTPYGASILFERLPDIFPNAKITSLREPIYNLLHESNEETHAAYLILAPEFGAGKLDVQELVQFAEKGNYVFLSVDKASRLLWDTLGLKRVSFEAVWTADSTALNFINPVLKADSPYRYRRLAVDEWFDEMNKPDSTTLLGSTQNGRPDFVSVKMGKGAIIVHAAPLAFTNYYMLFHNNHEYVSKALSFIPADVTQVYWDEYYKQGRTGPETPLRFFLSNEWLRWALRLSIIGFILYALVEMKRRQRIIPVIEPLRNTTLDFVKTVSSVYLAQKDNRSIGHAKAQFWLQHIRQRYQMPTNQLDNEFSALLSKRAGVEEAVINHIIENIHFVERSRSVTDQQLLQLNAAIEQFYILSKT